MLRWILVVSLVAAAQSAHAQMNMGGPAASFRENILRHTGSGTSLEPASGAPPMLMKMLPSGWMPMLHGEASAVEQQQTGPRGAGKFFSVNWAMPMARRQFGRNELTLRAMFSLEPATITGRFYPELFQEGETAYGKPIVDGQHPHNLFMEMVGLYDRRVGAHTVLSLYGGPVGDPALGPEAFPHRESIGDDPLAPLGHHLEDSTHIAFDAATVGVAWGAGQRGMRVEASGFHGREPGENRWTIEAGAMDSWAGRLTMTPGKDWSGQYSLGHLHSPEAVHPEEDVLRQTASIAYHHITAAGPLNAIAVWGRNHTFGGPTDANGFLFEAALRPQDKQTIWTRIENADRTTDLLGAAAPAEESVVGRVQAHTAGYAHRVWACGNGTAELGAQFTGYGVPGPLTPLYSAHPVGVAAVLKLRLGKGGQ